MVNLVLTTGGAHNKTLGGAASALLLRRKLSAVRSCRRFTLLGSTSVVAYGELWATAVWPHRGQKLRLLQQASLTRNCDSLNRSGPQEVSDVHAELVSKQVYLHGSARSSLP